MAIGIASIFQARFDTKCAASATNQTKLSDLRVVVIFEAFFSNKLNMRWVKLVYYIRCALGRGSPKDLCNQPTKVLMMAIYVINQSLHLGIMLKMID